VSNDGENHLLFNDDDDDNDDNDDVCFVLGKHT
jgi:hypothetical protein